MSDSSLPPPGSADGGADDGKNRPNAFDDFVNKDLDLSSLDDGDADKNERRPGEPTDKSFLRPLNPFPFPTPKQSDESPYGNLPGGRTNLPTDGDDDDPPPRFVGRLFGAPMPQTPAVPRLPAPSLEDPRWVRGVYRVQRDLRVYKNPSRHAIKIYTMADASRKIDKSLRFIPNMMPGWSAVHLYGEVPIVGFVDTSEVHLVARRGLRDVWEDIALVACLLLLALALIANLDQLPFFNGGDNQRITELEQTISEQQTQIDDLQSTIEAMRDTMRDGAATGAEEIQAR